jgi:malate dehydrogenase
VADRNVRVLVVGNPANTNALIAQRNAPGLQARNFTAMTRLDHNRALAQLAAKTGSHVSRLRRMTIWGNHSSTQYPDLSHATVDGKPARALVDEKWIAESFIPVVQQRGASVIKARGSSSAASAAAAALDHVRDWVKGTGEGDWVSMAVPADGSYGIKEGVVYSYPVTCKGGDYRIVPGLSIDAFSRARMDASDKELREERDGVEDLI